MTKIQIKCKKIIFDFEINDDSAAWFSFDHMISRKYGSSLEINADREVYAIYTNKNGKKYYGTIGDNENEVLADNDGCENGFLFTFYENPKTKYKYV